MLACAYRHCVHERAQCGIRPGQLCTKGDTKPWCTVECSLSLLLAACCSAAKYRVLSNAVMPSLILPSNLLSAALMHPCNWFAACTAAPACAARGFKGFPAIPADGSPVSFTDFPVGCVNVSLDINEVAGFACFDTFFAGGENTGLWVGPGAFSPTWRHSVKSDA